MSLRDEITEYLTPGNHDEDLPDKARELLVEAADRLDDESLAAILRDELDEAYSRLDMIKDIADGT